MKRVYAEDDVNGFKLIYNIETDNNTVKSLNCSASKLNSVPGGAFFVHQHGQEFPNSTFNQCAVDSVLQQHVMEKFQFIINDSIGTQTAIVAPIGES